MQAIKAYTQIYDDANNKDVLKKIETVGRTCYKSEGKIAEDSAAKFVSGLVKRNHEAMLEHASFIFECDFGSYTIIRSISNYMERCYLRFTGKGRSVASGNVRAWRDFIKACIKFDDCIPNFMKSFVQSNPILFPEYQDDALFENVMKGKLSKMEVHELTGDEKLVHQDVTVKFVTDRGISHEIVRHRPASFAQESTRYCNYSKDDFGAEITFILPPFLDYKSAAWNTWKDAMKTAESAYFTLLEIGLLPQEARDVLPMSVKTEVVMTANINEWKHFFRLRAANTTGAAHPQMLEITRPLLDDLKSMMPGMFDDIEY